MASNASGALFKNTRKSEDKHPDYQGNIEVTKEWLEAQISELGNQKSLKITVAGWKKESRNGPYISMSVNAPFKKGGDRPVPRRPMDNSDDPF